MKREIFNEFLFCCALQLIALCILPVPMIAFYCPLKAVFIFMCIIATLSFLGTSVYIWVNFGVCSKEIKKKYGRK